MSICVEVTLLCLEAYCPYGPMWLQDSRRFGSHRVQRRGLRWLDRCWASILSQVVSFAPRSLGLMAVASAAGSRVIPWTARS
ncbi:hypothetical protein EGX94_10080 [Propionibacterium acidifaciens]|nr:hypothetical protein EGX94_10080 [Propionibacterium acidifaciens]